MAIRKEKQLYDALIPLSYVKMCDFNGGKALNLLKNRWNRMPMR